MSYGEDLLINNVGEKFDLSKLLEARNLTINVVKNIAKSVFLGMSEEDGIKLIDLELKKFHVQKLWHPHKFRIGKNTTKSFKEESDPNVRLANGDIFFIDIGPVFFDHEGDYGETFVFSTYEKSEFSQKAKILFDFGSKCFVELDLTGKDLYVALAKEALNLKVKLHPKTLGHRLGDFPHHLFYRGKMNEVETKMLKNIWVLEIHILDLENNYGAFYEDILQK
jgi:hypothetical protein